MKIEMNSSISCKSPRRVMENTGDKTDDGKPMWVSREWRKGEREAYVRDFLKFGVMQCL